MDCYIGEKFHEPIEHEENCACRDEDYEWSDCSNKLFEDVADFLLCVAATTTSCGRAMSVSL